ncbi:DUF2461 domain-containing protein [Carboxylicivirga sp. N1Y90]|uniref:DUF2461 domain-containing protein n=1 Tax=Carboxylicivirga fragile TaxID=3417571 RepID=UPI003D34190F|nr:DUF2461 domain-containing protein [Marinilabiliaceae bacterium N1Y90]
MIEPIVYDFLKDLKVNNNREWFAEHKPRFQAAKLSFENSIQQFIEMIHKEDPSIGLPAPKDCVFRIYRDTRFAKDKTPYKTNMGAYVVNGGRKSPMGGYYIHIEPGASFVAGGIYCPPSDVLKKVRKEVYNFSDEFKEIIYDKQFKKLFPSLYEDKLKMAPKGFPKDFEDVDLLKYKSYIVSQELKDEELTGEKAKSILTKAIKTLRPLNDFINRGVASDEEEITL